MEDIPLCTSDQLTLAVPMIGVMNPDSPIATVMIDSPSMEIARQVSLFMMSLQDGKRTMAGAPVFFGDRQLVVDVKVGTDRVLVQVYPKTPRGHLTCPVLWSGWTPRMGWDLFSIYFRRSHQYTLAPSVNQMLPQELPSLVKYEIRTGTIGPGR